MKKKVKIFTDGACSGNPGPGGWAALILYQQHEKELTGYEPATTNNRMELMAAIQGLNALTAPCIVELTTDSRYLQKGMSEWLEGWHKSGKLYKENSKLKNQDLWQQLYKLSHKHQISWHWLRAHRGHPENERVDSLARDAIIRHK